MKVIGQHVTTRVPLYTHILDDASFGGYPFLSGKEISVSRYQHFSSKEKDLLAKQIASFISELHAIP